MQDFILEKELQCLEGKLVDKTTDYSGMLKEDFRH